MTSWKAALLFVGVAAAHSAVWNVTIDGTTYEPPDAYSYGYFVLRSLLAIQPEMHDLIKSSKQNA